VPSAICSAFRPWGATGTDGAGRHGYADRPPRLWTAGLPFQAPVRSCRRLLRPRRGNRSADFRGGRDIGHFCLGRAFPDALVQHQPDGRKTLWKPRQNARRRKCRGSPTQTAGPSGASGQACSHRRQHGDRPARITERRNRHKPGRQQDPGTAVSRLADRDQSSGEREQAAHHQVTGDVVAVGVLGGREPQQRYRARAQGRGSRRDSHRYRLGQRGNPRGPARIRLRVQQRRRSRLGIPHDEIIPEYGPGRKRSMSRAPGTSRKPCPQRQREPLRDGDRGHSPGRARCGASGSSRRSSPLR
jgi:hypothetical protein